MDRKLSKRHTKIPRETFLKLSAGAATGLLWATTPARAADAIATRPIPKSGEALPIVGLGTARVFNVASTPEKLAPLRQVLEVLFENSASLIDTARAYRRSEGVVGELLAQLAARDKAFVATKVTTRGQQAGIEDMETSFRTLRTSRVDLMQVHNLVDTETQLRTIRAWKDEGRILYTGITHSRPRVQEGLGSVMEREPLDFVQLNYSLSVRGPENRLLPLAADKGVAVMVNVPFGNGRLFGAVRGRALPPWAADFDCFSWAQFFLKYVLSHPAVTCVIPATGDPGHMIDNLGAGRGRMPDARERRRMVEFWESL